MKRLFLGILALVPAMIAAKAQQGYTAYIQLDTAIAWSGESNKVVDLSPKVSTYSLKRWYLDKLRKDHATAYRLNGPESLESFQLSLPELGLQDWLKGLKIERPPFKNPKEWYFTDPTKSSTDLERIRYHTGPVAYATDSCCGCDNADAFRVKQVLSYRHGRFNIYNVFISPLCLRQSAGEVLSWFPLCNVAYNDNAERKFPGLSKDVVLLNTDEVEYEFGREFPSREDSVLTVFRTDIGSLVYQDILGGLLKAVDPETGRPIPVKQLLTWQMPADTVADYDPEDPSVVKGYKVVQQERSSVEFSRFRIRQDLYFDFKNERLYSIVRSVTIILPVRNYDGGLRGYRPFCRIVPNP